MGIKYNCDDCEKELAGPDVNYASKQFNRSTDKLNVRFAVGAKGKVPEVLCKACAAGRVKSIIEDVAKEAFTGEVE